MPELPDWTEFCTNESEHRGLDPLGLEAVGASIVQNRLLPGITNATRHIRYYSFFCWVFWKFWNSRSGKARLVTCRRVTITRLLASKLSWLLAAKSCSPSNSSPI